MNEVAALLLVLFLLGIIAATVHFARTRWSWSAEGSRKAIHLGMGMVTLLFPWLFSSVLTVWIIALIALVPLLLLRLRPHHQAAEMLHGVRRSSYGEICFPLGVAVLFTLSEGDPARYLPPLLVLTFADGLAALAGVRYGKLHYVTDEGTKSLEGSLAFFTVAFLATFLCLLLTGEESLSRVFALALLFGMVTVVIEAIAWRGLDNLFLPLLGLLFLDAYRAVDETGLWLRFTVLLLLLGFTFWRKHRTTLNDSALIGSALFGYLVWAVGGWIWVLPPLLLFLAYPRLIPYRPGDTGNTETAVGVLAVVLVGLLILLLDREASLDTGFLLYSFSFAAHLGLIWLERAKGLALPHVATVLLTALLAQGLILGSSLFLTPIPATPGLVLTAFGLGLCLHLLRNRGPATPTGQPFRLRGWVDRTLLVLAATLLLALFFEPSSPFSLP